MSAGSLPPDLARVFAHLDAPEAIERLLTDLLSPAELRSLRERWGIVRGLAAGKTQREVRDELGVGIATVSRGAHQLRHGTGGFALGLEALRQLEAGARSSPAEEPTS